MENRGICQVCKGACCKASAGYFFPDELKEPVSEDYLYKLLNSGFYAIDWFEFARTGEKLYYLRYAHKNINRLLDNSRLKSCVLLTENGCILPHDDRPMICRELIPAEDYNCYFTSEKLNKRYCALAWKPFQEIITATLNRFGISL